MKNIKLLYILSVLLIIVTGTTCVSCTTDDMSEVQRTVNNRNIVPDSLEGSFYSPNHLESDIVITEDYMMLNFKPFVNNNLQFDIENVQTSETNTSFTVHYYDGVDIIFNYILDSDDITVIYDDNGTTYDLGQFTKN